jgi:hypothetical protein
MREITVVEKANNPSLPNAMHITTKSKVSKSFLKECLKLNFPSLRAVFVSSFTTQNTTKLLAGNKVEGMLKRH